MARARERAGKLLPPVRYVARGTIAVDHPQGRLADVRQLMKDARRDIDHLPRRHRLAYFAETHLAHAFDDEIDFLLLLIVPGHLAAFRIESHIAHRKIRRLNWRGAAREVLRQAFRRITATGDLGEVGD